MEDAGPDCPSRRSFKGNIMMTKEQSFIGAGYSREKKNNNTKDEEMFAFV